MPNRNKTGSTDRKERPARAMARAWADANKLHDGGKKAASRRKLPSGPLGGSGRKTNLSRSS